MKTAHIHTSKVESGRFHITAFPDPDEDEYEAVFLAFDDAKDKDEFSTDLEHWMRVLCHRHGFTHFALYEGLDEWSQTTTVRELDDYEPTLIREVEG